MCHCLRDKTVYRDLPVRQVCAARLDLQEKEDFRVYRDRLETGLVYFWGLHVVSLKYYRSLKYDNRMDQFNTSIRRWGVSVIPIEGISLLFLKVGVFFSRFGMVHKSRKPTHVQLSFFDLSNISFPFVT